MATETEPPATERPPIPDDWAGEPLFVIFFIPAPIPLALPHGCTWKFLRPEDVDWLRGIARRPTPDVPPQPPGPGEDGKNFVSFQVWREHDQRSVDLGPLTKALHVYAAMAGEEATQVLDPPEYNIEGESGATVFEAVTPLLPSVSNEGAIDLATSLSDAFDRCLENLSRLYKAYIMRSDDYRVQVLNRQNIFPLIPWTTRNPFLDPIQYGGLDFFLVNPGEQYLPRAVQVLSDDEAHGLIGAMHRVVIGDPFTVSVDHRRAAEKALYVNGDYPAAVVWTHTASEVFFNSTLLLLAWEESLSPTEVSKWFRKSLVSRIKQQLPERLVREWLVDQEGTIAKYWIEHVHRIRNKVVHEGYQPTEEEAVTALEVSRSVIEHIKVSLFREQRTYPRSIMLVLGIEGLTKRDVWKGDVKEYIESLQLDLTTLPREFVEWSRQVRTWR